MPRRMPPMAFQFGREVSRALAIAQAGEIIRSTAQRASVARRQLHQGRLEALYEMAYLRVFITWELFLDESFLRYLCGYMTSTGAPALLQSAFRTIVDARNAVLGAQKYVSWSDPNKVEHRLRTYIQNGSHELVIRSNRARLGAFAAVRHRIAHGSAHAHQQFDLATMMLAGRRYRGASPGRFLRDWNPHPTPDERWIQTLGTELKSLAKQIAP
jgi:hypothetical protein